MPTSKFTQANRMMQLDTPLGKDVLLINKMTVEEGVSQLYSIEAEVLHEEKDGWKIPEPIDFGKILGQGVSISIAQGETQVEGRSFSGLVSEFAYGWRSERFSVYRMKIVPTLWIYTQNLQSRIFQQKSVPAIIKDVLRELENFIVWETEYDYKPRNYCVQYQESDFDFISRLMEEEGIYYYFEHAAGSHKLVISDRPQFNRNVPGRGELHFRDNTDEHIEIFSSTMIREWGTDFKIGPGLFSFRDHNIQQPGKKLATSSKTKLTAGDSAAWEVYDYPGGYAKKFDGVDPGGEKSGDLDNIIPDGKRTAQIASEVLDAGFKTARAKSDCSSLIAGYLFKLIKHPVKDENGQYVVTSIRHSAAQSPAYDQNDATYDTDGEAYVNEFRALEHARSGAVPFRSEPVTPRPIIYGAQTAVVVGTSGEEIYTDEYGRIKVQFHWDRDGMSDGSDSCWLPVAQTWAGNGWGSVYIPRVGMEVIVHFMEGDPDQPFVSGCIYNPGNMPPYKLPKEKTKSTIKTDSSKGGNGFNEIRFEDKKGSEQIFIHGEKNQDIRIKEDCKELIKRDRHLIAERDQFEKIKRDKHLQVVGDHNEKIDGTMSIKIGTDLQEKVGSKYGLEAGMEAHIKGGTNVVVEAGTTLTLKVGGNFININSGGIFIKGTMVMLNSGGAAGSGAGCNPELPKDPLEADNADPGKKPPRPENPPRPPKAAMFGPMAALMKSAATSGSPFCDI